MRCHPAVRLAVVALLVTPSAASAQRPMSDRNVEKVIKAALEIDPWSVDGQRARQAKLAELADQPPPTAREVAAWQKKILKLWARGDRLENGSGDHRLWEDEQRGRYLIGGKTKRPSGLAICMHGGGRGSGDAGSAKSSYDSAVSRMGWVGIYPEVLEKTERGWTDSGTEEFVLELIERGRRTFKVDADRVYLIGHSMGGYGSWTLGAHHADRVAAIAPSAGAPTPILERGTDKPIDVVEGVIPNLRNVPNVVFQSDDDPRVPPDVNQLASRKVVEAREKWGGYTDFTYWEVTGRGHGAPEGGFVEHLEKVANFARTPFPERVVWQPTLGWKPQFYWLWWDRPVRNAIVVADWDREANTVEITADASVDLSGLHVLLRSDLADFDAEFVVRVNGAETWRGVPERSLEVVCATALSGDPQRSYEAKVPVRPR